MSKKTRRYFSRLCGALPKLQAYARRVKLEKLPLGQNEYPIAKEVSEIEDILRLHKHGNLQEVR